MTECVDSSLLLLLVEWCDLYDGRGVVLLEKESLLGHGDAFCSGSDKLTPVSDFRLRHEVFGAEVRENRRSLYTRVFRTLQHLKSEILACVRMPCCIEYWTWAWNTTLSQVGSLKFDQSNLPQPQTPCPEGRCRMRQGRL